MTVQAYPYTQWPRIQRADIARYGRMAAWFPSELGPALRAAETILGAAPLVDSFSFESCAPGPLPAAWNDPIAAIVLIGPALHARLAIEFSPGLAAALADRVLGGSADDAEAYARDAVPLEDAEAGALAYLASSLLVHTEASSRWRVGTVLTTQAGLRTALGESGCLVATASMRVGKDHGTVRVWLPHDVPEAQLSAQASPGPALPLIVCADVGLTELSREDAHSLRVGDVVLLDDHFDEGALRCRTLGGERTTWWCDNVGTIQRIVTQPALAVKPGETIVDEEQTQPARAIGDTPITLSVEMARITVPLDEASRWRVGSVIGVGARVGDRVALRAGDAVIALGELVDIEGEVGVRLTELRRSED